jgi:hypothetical protein
MAKRIEVEIVGDTRGLSRAFRDVGRDSNHLQGALRGVGKASAIAIGSVAGAGLVGLGFAAKAAMGEFVQQQKVVAQTGAVIKSTGGAANVTAKQVRELAAAQLKKTGIDDEVIQSGENMLLTFRNIRNEVGAGNDIFNQATQAGLDMSTAMEGAGFEGGNLKTTMIRLGKALNDPVTGMTALRRVGVTFSEDQKKLIKHLETTGHHLEAQKLILKELRAEFAGSAEAYGKTLPGRLTILKESLKNVGATVIGYLVPAMEKGMEIAGRFGSFVETIAKAPNIKVAFSIAGSGVADLAGEIKDAIGRGIASQDWTSIGTQLAAVIGHSIRFSADVLSGALDSMLSWVSDHGQQIATVGAELAVQMALTLTDPVFWAHHMDLLVGVLAIAFGGAVGKFAGRAGGILLRYLGPPLERASGEVALVFMRGVARLPNLLGDAIAAGSSVVAKAASSLWAEIARGAGAEASRLENFLARALRLGAVVTAFRLGVSRLQDAWVGFEGWITEHALRAVRLILEPFSHLPGRLGGWARSAKDSVNAHLQGIEAEQTGRRIARMGDRFSATAPKINAAGAAARELAAALHRVPSDTTIRFIVRTLTFTPGNAPGGGKFQGGGHRAGGRIDMGSGRADDVPALLSRGEFVVTPGGEKMLESMTFPGVLSYLGQRQPPAFAGGGRVGESSKRIEMDRLYPLPLLSATGGASSTSGLVPQVVAALAWARSHGWHGSVTSGFRSYAKQAGLYAAYLAGTGNLAAPPGHSSHERGQAVDVTDYGAFGAAMATAPPGARLYNRLGAADPVHYSVTGFRVGGSVTEPIVKIDSHPILGGLTNVAPLSAPISSIVAKAVASGSLPSSISSLVSSAVASGGTLANPSPGPLGSSESLYVGKPPPARIIGIRHKIAKVRREERAQKQKLAGINKRLSAVNREIAAENRKKHPNKARLRALEAKKKRIEGEQNRAQGVLSNERSALGNLGQEAQSALSQDYSTLPSGIQLEIARAALTETETDDVSALRQAEGFLERQLRKRGLTQRQKAGILDALAGVRGQLADLRQKVTSDEETARQAASSDAAAQSAALADLPLDIQESIANADLTEGTADDIAAYRAAQAYYQGVLGDSRLSQEDRINVKRSLKGVNDTLDSLLSPSGGAGGAGVVDADLAAQLAQEQARSSAATKEAALANAFVSTGVFAAPAGAGGGGPTIVVQSLIPDHQQIVRAADLIATGAGSQGYRTASSEVLGP